jgi:hypothetical protein
MNPAIKKWLWRVGIAIGFLFLAYLLIVQLGVGSGLDGGEGRVR